VFDWTEGNVVQVDIYPSSSSTSPTRTATFAYQAGSKAGDDINLLPFINYARRDQSPQLLSRTIAQDGDTYSRTTAANEFDSYGFPLQVIHSNNFGYNATASFTYQHDSTNWVLGNVTTHSINGVLAEKSIYTALDQVQEFDKFGELQYTFGYDSTGLLRTEMDGLSHTTNSTIMRMAARSSLHMRR